MQELLFLILLLVAGGFIKIFTTLQIFRIGIGLYGGAVGVLVFLVAFLLSLFVFHAAFPGDFSSADVEQGKILQVSAPLDAALRPFLEKHSSQQERDRLQALHVELSLEREQQVEAAGEEAPTVAPISHLLLAFTLTELKEAFQLGLQFIVPFLIIDILVVHVLQLLAVTQISAWSFAFPIKLLLFLAVDGWLLISERLIGGYLGGA